MCVYVCTLQDLSHTLQLPTVNPTNHHNQDNSTDIELVGVSLAFTSQPSQPQNCSHDGDDPQATPTHVSQVLL